MIIDRFKKNPKKQRKVKNLSVKKLEKMKLEKSFTIVDRF